MKMIEETVFEKAVDEFYEKLQAMADSLAADCNDPSPTLAAAARDMMCDAAVHAIGKFAKAARDTACNPHSLDA
jgi:hypothetical protein